jgi:branched-chain amino acid transport system ATP-binding protein
LAHLPAALVIGSAALGAGVTYQGGAEFPLVLAALSGWLALVVADTLGGGEQQMLATARALMAHPKPLWKDEPSMGPVPIRAVSFFSTMKTVYAEGTAILLVEQNASMALQVARRGYVLQTGLIVLAKSAADLRNDPMPWKAFMGL